jgi:hypothetical protein
MCEAEVNYFQRGDVTAPPLPRTVLLHDARKKECRLDVQGYELTSFAPFLDDGINSLAFENPGGFASSIFPQAEKCLLGHISGASRVLCFDHIVRDGGRKKPETTGKKETNEVTYLGGPIPQVHNDYRSVVDDLCLWHVCARVCVYVCVHACVVHMYVCMHVLMYVHGVCMYVCMYACGYVCMHACTQRRVG